MATRITETEVVANAGRKITLAGMSFRVPLTPTIQYMFWVRGFLARFQAGEITDDDTVDCYDQTIAFLRRYNPTVDEEKLQASCELEDLITFYSRCFGAESEAKVDEERPTPPTRGGASTKATKPKSRSST